MSRGKYRKIYEQYHGPIPIDSDGRTYDIHHIDGDHTNNAIENLVAVPIQEHYRIHKEQKDWGACWSISLRMNITVAERSEIAKLATKKRRAPAGKDNPRYINTIYTLYHDDGRIFTGTQYEFYTTHPGIHAGSLSCMLRGVKSCQGYNVNHVKGWRIKPN